MMEHSQIVSKQNIDMMDKIRVDYDCTETHFQLLQGTGSTDQFQIDETLPQINYSQKLNSYLNLTSATSERITKILQTLKDRINKENEGQPQKQLKNKHLLKLWITHLNRYFEGLQGPFPHQQVAYFRSLTQKNNIAKSSFRDFLRYCPNIRCAIFDAFFETDQALKVLWQTNLRNQSKYILIQSYMIIKNALKTPESFLTLSNPRLNRIMQGQSLQQKCTHMSLVQIKEVVSAEFQKHLQQQPHKKCSIKNNVTYYWISILKQILAEFKSVNPQVVAQVIKKHGYNINWIKQLLHIGEFNAYLKEQQLKDDFMVKSIIANHKLNITIKHHLLATYDRFKQAVQDPSTLRNWGQINI